MEDGNSRLTKPGKEEGFLAVTTVVLFGCVLVVTIVRLAAGWQSGSWPVLWDVVGVAFGLSLLMYLGSGGAETVLELKRSDSARKLTVAAMVGRVGAALLFLAFVGNFVAAIWESRSTVLVIVRDSVGGGFALCLIVYLALRFAERHRVRAVKPSSGEDPQN